MHYKTTSLCTAAFIALGLGTAGAQDKDIYYITTGKTNVRAAPSTTAERIGYLGSDRKVLVLGKATGDSWMRVQLDSGQIGYIYAALLKEEATAAADKPKLTGGPTAAPENAYLYFVWPNNGEIIPCCDFWVRFGLRNMGVAPAGIVKEATGHHHLLIDTDLPPLDKEIVNDDNHVHFGRGQTEYRIKLQPGKHTLQLLLGDDKHIPHTPPVMSEKITVEVR